MATYLAYPFSFFLNNKVLPDKLQKDINESDVSIKPTAILTDKINKICTIRFDNNSSCPPGDKVAIDLIVAEHEGYEIVPEYITTTKLISEVVNITTQDWTISGGVIAHIGVFVPDTTQAITEILGSCRAQGEGAEVRIVEEDTQGGKIIVAGPQVIPSGDWQIFRFRNSVAPKSTPCTYTLETRLNNATSANLRFVSVTLFKLNRREGIS